MDNLEYLQHISQSNRPTSSSKISKLNLGPIIKLLIGGILAAVLLIGIGLLINGNSTRSTDITKQLYVRMDNVNKLIDDFNKNLKSSQLRAINYSLSGTITGTMPQLAEYLKASSSESKGALTPPAKLLSEETQLYNSTGLALTDAKLSGTLDRIYTARIHMLVSLLMSLTSEVLARDDSTTLHSILDNFYSNLNNIEQTLNNYSDASN